MRRFVLYLLVLVTTVFVVLKLSYAQVVCKDCVSLQFDSLEYDESTDSIYVDIVADNTKGLYNVELKLEVPKGYKADIPVIHKNEVGTGEEIHFDTYIKKSDEDKINYHYRRPVNVYRLISWLCHRKRLMKSSYQIV